jgi:helix-turn-helix protein
LGLCPERFYAKVGGQEKGASASETLTPEHRRQPCEDTSMSIPMVAYVRDHAKVTGSAHHLLLVIASYIHPTLGYAWPSVTTLAHTLEVTPRRIYQLLHDLESTGYLSIERGGGRRTNHYRLPLPLDGGMKSTDEIDFTAPLQSTSRQPCNPLHPERVVNRERKEEPIARAPKPEMHSPFWYHAHGFAHSARLPNPPEGCDLEASA